MMLNYQCAHIIPYAKSQGLSIWTMRDLLTKLEDMGIDTYRFNDFKKVVDYIKDNEPRTCQRMIRAGARKGSICGRRIYRCGKCPYHNRVD